MNEDTQILISQLISRFKQLPRGHGMMCTFSAFTIQKDLHFSILDETEVESVVINTVVPWFEEIIKETKGYEFFKL